MFRFLVVLFIVIPAIELWGLISVGKVIGPWWTVILVVLMGFIGAWLAKQQGMQVIRLLQMQLSRGEMPTDALIDGALVLAGGILLLTPGFVTDILGIIALIPYTRMVLRHLLKQWLLSLIRSGKIHFMFRR